MFTLYLMHIFGVCKGPIEIQCQPIQDMHACMGCGMGLLPDTQNCRLRMRRECRERFPGTAG